MTTKTRRMRRHKTRPRRCKTRTRKHRSLHKRKYYGGDGFTITEDLDPLAYKEDEYDQLKNSL